MSNCHRNPWHILQCMAYPFFSREDENGAHQWDTSRHKLYSTLIILLWYGLQCVVMVQVFFDSCLSFAFSSTFPLASPSLSLSLLLLSVPSTSSSPSLSLSASSSTSSCWRVSDSGGCVAITGPMSPFGFSGASKTPNPRSCVVCQWILHLIPCRDT